MDILKLFLFPTGISFLLCAFTVSQSLAAFSLEECVEMALSNNPDLQKQQMNLDLAHTDLDEEKSRNFGSLNIVSSFTHYNQPRTLTPMTPALIMDDPAAVPSTEDLFTAGIVYEIPLFTGFSQTRKIEVAALEKKMAAAALKLSREQLIYNVKTLYVNILSQQAQDKAQDAYVTALQSLHNNIIREVELGKKARIDELKAAADLKNAEAKKFQISANIKVMKAALASLLNVDHIPELQDINLAAESIVAIEDNFMDQLAGLQRLRAARLNIEKNTKLVEKVKGSFYPQIGLNTSYGQNFGPNDDSNKYDGDWENQEVWQAGLNLKWNIFDFGERGARVQKAKIRERQSRQEQTKIKLELRRALQEAVTRINTAVSDYNSAEAELALTKETETIEQIRFKKGAADINDLLYAKARNQLALSRFLNARCSYKNGCFYLDYLLENGENK